MKSFLSTVAVYMAALVLFSVAPISADTARGAMTWNGLVKGDTIEATSKWTRERWYWKTKREYWYRGELKK